jgi:hypothetical protein
VICAETKAEYFCKQDWTGQISLMGHKKSDFGRSHRMTSSEPHRLAKLLVSRQTQADGIDPMPFPVTEHVLKTKRHTTAYLACGAPDGSLIIFLHGWPELAISWRHQLPAFAELGFFCVAPDMNHKRNAAYAATALNQGRLSMPVLFLGGANDLTCMTTGGSRLAEPMRQYCDDLTEVAVQSGHSIAQECPVRVNAALAKWLATRLTNVWPA